MAVIPAEFFREVQGAAVLKHGILKRYLAVFTGKLGSTAEGGRVCYLDAYAGPGQYEGGGEGSPAIAAATAETLQEHRNLVGIYVENDDENLAKLKDFFAKSKQEHHILAGQIQDNLQTVLSIVSHSPLLAFFDPFGLPIPMEQLKALLQRPKPSGAYRTPPTELIIHVSYPGIARLCGFIASKKAETNDRVRKQRDTIVKKCDLQLGGDWWHTLALERPEGWIGRIAHGYAKKLHDLTGAGWFRVPVRDRPGARVSYELLLASNYTHEAHWAFHEQVSLGNEDWRKFNQQHAEQQQLKIDEDTWVEEIKKNIAQILTEGDFTVRDKWNRVYGEATFGLARGKHVRKAIKQLHRENVTSCDGVGDVPDLRITRGAKAPPLATK